MVQDSGVALFPVVNALAYVDPVAQADGLLLGGADVVAAEGSLEGALAAPDPGLVLAAQGVEVGRVTSVLDGLVGVEDAGKQAGLLDLEGLVGGYVDAAEGEEVLGAEEGIGKGAVGVVDGGREGLSLGLEVGRLLVRVVGGLEAEELASQEGGVDGEVARGRGPGREGGGEVAVEGGGRG